MDLLKNKLKALVKNEAVGSLVGNILGCSSTSTTNDQGDGFVHPGTLMGPQEIGLLRQRVAAGQQPWAAAAKQLSQDTPLDYTPHALQNFDVGWNGVGQGHDELVEKDGKMVYMQTIMWLISGNAQYADNACAIIRAWATTCTVFKGNNAPLEGGWGTDSLSRSAELLKHTYAGWSPQLEQQYVGWVRQCVMPQLHKDGLWVHLPIANWQSTIGEAKAQFAILTGDRALWQESLDDWRRIMDAYITPCGECTETKRDLFHSQFGLGGLIQLAEMAWQQGLDLYGYDCNKLAAGMEFHAAICNGEVPPQCCYPLVGIGFLPCGWEVGYNHYTGRRGVAMPQTAKLLAANRPEKYVFHWGLGTLTHYGTAEVLRPDAPLAPS